MARLARFSALRALVFGSITDLLDEQFARLSALEQSVLCWLAIAREPMTLNELLGRAGHLPCRVPKCLKPLMGCIDAR